MPMKPTDLQKNMAKKLEGGLKKESLPDRFGQAAAASTNKRERAAAIPASKLVPVSYRLPAELVNRLRDAATGHEGGVNGVVAAALTAWLDKKQQNT